MQAVVFETFGGPEVLHLADRPEPHAGSGQIRIRVRATGVTPADWALRSGAFRSVVDLELPHIPGMDAAGVVDEIGPGVTGLALGDAVFGLTPPAQTGGGHAEYAVLATWTRKPSAVSWTQAGGAAGNVETATRVLDLLDVTAGTTLLIEGASGGVGTIAIQLAVARGATVIGTASERNHDFLRSLGARATTYGPGLAERLAELGVGRPDAVLDAAGSGSLPDLVAIADGPDAVVSIADMHASDHGVRLSTSQGPSATATNGSDGLRTAARLMDTGQLTIPVDRTFPADAAAAAHSYSETRRARGKIVITFP